MTQIKAMQPISRPHRKVWAHIMGNTVALRVYDGVDKQGRHYYSNAVEFFPFTSRVVHRINTWAETYKVEVVNVHDGRIWV
ncbi:hypothetical protein LCGC14_2753860 [marine sediment metagenome]|uniref:Uncharacterized protein n=1 Tax=marine sediment metagenome TaxID=412755 RepID=A0A0F8Z105_9ZZZZ